MNLKNIIEKNDTPHGRIFDLCIQVLVVVSLVTFSIETLPHLSDTAQRYLRYAEIIIVVVFTIEYLLRIVVADNKIKFMLSFYGLIDLCAILPFYITAGIDLRSIRILRLLRLFRAFKLLRYSAAMQRFHRALIIAREDLILFSIVAVMVFYFSAIGIYFFEHDAQPEAFSSVFQSLWWAVATLTTVGYGDVFPVTIGGKLFTFAVLMVGLGIVAVPTGLISSALSVTREMEKETDPQDNGR